MLLQLAWDSTSRTCEMGTLCLHIQFLGKAHLVLEYMAGFCRIFLEGQLLESVWAGAFGDHVAGSKPSL